MIALMGGTGAPACLKPAKPAGQSKACPQFGRSSERKNAAPMIGNNDLFPRKRMPPLLMAPGSAGSQKAVTAENSNYLV